MIHSHRIFQLALRQSQSQTPKCWRPPFRKVSTAAQPNVSSQPSRWTRRLIYAGIFGSLGVGAGKWLDDKVSAPPAPGTLEDKSELQEIQRVFDIGLPIVQELRRNPDYVEKEVYENFADEHINHRLTSGPLAGSRGLGLQVSFVLCFSHWRCPRHVLHGCRTTSTTEPRDSGSSNVFALDRKFSGMTRKRRTSAWSSWGPASKAGQLWSMAVRSGL